MGLNAAATTVAAGTEHGLFSEGEERDRERMSEITQVGRGGKDE